MPWAYSELIQNSDVEETIMSFIDSPIASCKFAHEIVLTDQTQGQCAQEHECPPGTKCPLCGYFPEAEMIPLPEPAA